MSKIFGPLLRELRLKNKITLRSFCIKTWLEPATVSCIEREVLDPPQSPKILKRITEVLRLVEGTSEYEEFILAAETSRAKFKDSSTQTELLGKLPLVPLKTDGTRLSEEQIDRLLKMVKAKFK